MAFFVVAQPPDEFASWLSGQQAPATQPDTPLVQRGAQVFAREGCIACHSIRYGNEPVGGTIGPDLTHLASRSTIAAGTLTNVRGNLAGWILNSQAIKPGNKMPPKPVPGDDLQVLLDYLETLK
jgi:cytochrome c oxidase subunit 2